MSLVSLFIAAFGQQESEVLFSPFPGNGFPFFKKSTDNPICFIVVFKNN